MRLRLGTIAVVVGVFVWLMTNQQGETGSRGPPEPGTGLAPAPSRLPPIDPERFEAVVRERAFTEIPDGWNLLAILRHATNFGRSDNPGSRAGALPHDSGRPTDLFAWGRIRGARAGRLSHQSEVERTLAVAPRPLAAQVSR